MSDFAWALQMMQQGKSVKRKGWQDGVCAYFHDPKKSENHRGKYAKESLKMPYLATCHVAACELAGVRLVSDFLAVDWELMYE